MMKRLCSKLDMEDKSDNATILALCATASRDALEQLLDKLVVRSKPPRSAM